jgi:hypothetical protein
MNTIAHTTNKEYLSGLTAFNIPTIDGNCADWHGTSIFNNKNTKFIVAGNQLENTNHIFGLYGTYECSEILKKNYKTILVEKVYAANYIRALLDIVYNSSFKKRKPETSIHEVLDSQNDKIEFWKMYKKLKEYVKDSVQLAILIEWEHENEIY